MRSNILKAPLNCPGGNLTLGVLSHISHPHPKIPPLPLSTPFRGIVLLTPWAAFSKTPSFDKNEYRDVVNEKLCIKWSQAFLGNAPPDPYNVPLTADAEWWRDVRAEEILVVASADECLTDIVRAMGEKLKVIFLSLLTILKSRGGLGRANVEGRQSVHPKTTTIFIPGEYHDQPVIRVMGGGGEQGRVIKSWIASRVR